MLDFPHLENPAILELHNEHLLKNIASHDPRGRENVSHNDLPDAKVGGICVLCRFWIVSLLFGRSPILMIDSILLCLPPHPLHSPCNSPSAVSRTPYRNTDTLGHPCLG